MPNGSHNILTKTATSNSTAKLQNHTCNLHTGWSKKPDTQFNFLDNVGNSAPILTILSLLQAAIFGEILTILSLLQAGINGAYTGSYSNHHAFIV